MGRYAMKRILGIVVIASMALFIGVSGIHAATQAKSTFEKMDADGNKNITATEEKAYIENSFKSLDANKDRKLTRDEFMSDKEAVFNDMDVNKDGLVSIQEFVGYLCGKPPKAVKAKKSKTVPKSHLQKADRNKDGKVTEIECVEYVEILYNYADGKGEGKITKEAFLERMKDVFKHMDKNKDGVVTVEEYNIYWLGKGQTVIKGGKVK